MSEKYKVGIDLGTTYSCLSYINEEGNAVVEKNFEQEDTTPSVILFNDNGEIIVGSPAKDMSIMYSPERTVTAIKRQIGTDYEVIIDGEKYTPISLSASILKKIIDDFNDNHGCELKKAVITCPAYFGQQEREATITAGRIAGLEDVTIINEPTAAAISFGFKASDTDKRILVFDLGGGTFDVTVLNIVNGDFIAYATDGERLLGGKDWDAAIIKLIKEKVMEEGGIDEYMIDEDDDVRQSLILDSETVKKRLSTAESTKGTLNVDGKKIIYTITREEFENATSHLLGTTLEIIDRVLDSVKLTMKDIDEVILVGGSSKMPQIKNGISAKYPDANVKIFDPDQSIAKGAAIFAMGQEGLSPVGPIVNPNGEIVEPVPLFNVHNVLSKSFGIKAIYEENGDYVEKISNIIFRNEVLPIEAHKRYFPQEDGQTSIKVEIFDNAGFHDHEGETIDIIEGYPVGDFEVELPEGVTRDTEINITFVANEEGILTAYVDCLDKHADYKLSNPLQMSESEIEDAAALMNKVTNAN